MTDTLQLGTRLVDEYQIIRVLGGGGFGNTYLALDLQLNREVAIKEFYPREIALREAETTVRVKNTKFDTSFTWGLERFVQEARMLAKFRHPNIVRVFRTFEANNTSYIVLDYVRGPDLEAWLKTLGRAPGQDELDLLAAPLVEALEFVHEAGILHRDIKPANICVREETGDPVLLDFGASKYSLGNLTGTTAAIISRGYSPYEAYAADSKSQGPWTDIYGLGATLYRAITQEPPPEATERLLEDSLELLHPRAKTLGNYRPDFLKAIDWALSVQPSARPQKIAEWKPALLKGSTDPANSWATQMRRLNDKTELLSPATGRSKPAPQAEAAKPSGGKSKVLVTVALAALVTGGAGFAALHYGLVERSAVPEFAHVIMPAPATRQAPGPQTADTANTLPALLDKAASANPEVKEARTAPQAAIELPSGLKPADAPLANPPARMANIIRSEPIEPQSRLFSSEEDGPLSAVVISNDGRVLVAGGLNGSLRAWDVPGGKLSNRIQPTGAPILALDSVGPGEDGDHFLAATADNSLVFWTPAQGLMTPYRSNNAWDGFIRSIGYNGETGYAVTIATSASSTRLTNWRLDAKARTIEEASSFEIVPGMIRAAAIARKADLAIVVKADETIEAIITGSGKSAANLSWVPPAPGWTSVLALSQDGTLLARGGQYQSVSIVDLRSQKITEVKLDAQPQAYTQGLAFSSDGKQLAIAYQTYADREPQNLIRVVALPNGALLHTFKSPSPPSRWLAFLPGGSDGRTGIAIAQGGIVRMCASIPNCDAR